ncbi:hypothetical protein EFM17_02315 [Lactobacillus delbrueckii]|nr:hypothetical protein [Lactobacillus delbrueckii]
MLSLLCLLFILWLCWKMGVALWRVLIFLIGVGLAFALLSSVVLPLLAIFALGGLAWAVISNA